MKNILIILGCLSTTDLLGQEYDVAPADQLGMLDENLFGVWETTEDVAILRMHLRPDGIGVWNGDVFGNQSIYHIWVSRYGVADGRLLMGDGPRIITMTSPADLGLKKVSTSIWRMMKLSRLPMKSTMAS